MTLKSLITVSSLFPLFSKFRAEQGNKILSLTLALMLDPRRFDPRFRRLAIACKAADPRVGPRAGPRNG